MQRARIYLKQLHHDLCLRDLKNIERIFKDRFRDFESHSLFADIYELTGENMVMQKRLDDFDDYFEKAIKLR